MAPWDQYQRSQYLNAQQRHRYTRYSREDSSYEEWCEMVLDMPYAFWTYCQQQEGGNVQAFILGLIHEHRVKEAAESEDVKEPEPPAI